MVKAVQAEDSLEQHFDGLLKARVPAEVGLLVGKPSVGSRDLVLAAVPTPNADGQVLTVSAASAGAGAAASAAGGKPKKGGGGGSSAAAGRGGGGAGAGLSVALDSEGVAEHALQVAMMLPGGLAVLGLYLFAPEPAYSACSAQLAAALASIAADAAGAACPAPAGKAAAAAAQQQQELLLLHVDASTRKFTMRACLASSGAAAAAGSLKPVELKFGPCLASLVALRARHAFDLHLPATAGGAQLQALLQDAAAAEAGRVMSSLALLPGAAPAGPSQPLADLLPANSSSNSSGSNSAAASISSPAWVDLFCSPVGAGPGAAAAAGQQQQQGQQAAASGKGGGGGGGASSAFVGSCRLAGCVEALAYVHRRDSAAKALTELRQDVARSLAARLAALADDALAAADAAEEQEQESGQAGSAAVAVPAHPLLAAAGTARRTLCGLPRRVLLPWSDLGLQVCAYLAEDEGPGVAAERAQQLLPLPQLTPGQVQEVEGRAVQQGPLKGTAVGAGGGAGAGATCGSTVMAAAAAGVVAALSVALAYLNLGSAE